MARKPAPKQAARRQRKARPGQPAGTDVGGDVGGALRHPGVDQGPPPPVPGPGPGGGGGGGGGGEAPPNDLGIPGLPPEIANRIHEIFVSGRDDYKEQAVQYLMGTAWFKTEYAGFDQGFTNGMFSDPLSGGLAEYRQYKQQAQAAYRQYYGTDLNVADLVGYIGANKDVARISQEGQGHVQVTANAGEWNYLTGAFDTGQLSDAEKKAYGEELAGIDTALGQSVKAKVENAMNRMQRIFGGTVAGSALGDQGLGSRLQKKPDIQA